MKPNEKSAGAIKVGKDSGRVKVFVRVRPQRPQENSRKEPIAITVIPDKKSGQIHVSDPKHSWEKTYKFDHVFPPHSTNSEVCSMISRPIVNSAMNGFNGTLMAYGQTGSGKTYTLMAPDGITAAVTDRCFKKITLDERHDYKVTMAYLQIYQEKLYDLLNFNSKVELSIREHPLKGIYVENLSAFVVRCPTDVSSLLAVGRKRLVFAETKMNRTSSRSHSVCQLTIERTLNKEKAKLEGALKEPTSRNGFQGDSGHKGSATTGKNPKVCNGHASQVADDDEEEDNEDEPLTNMAAFDNDDVLVRGKICLCDLAGSERLKKTQAEGERLSEAQHINSSLLELGNVIQALAEGKKNHVPFRNSTLTRLLQESLGGNCKTSLMVCVSPTMSDVSESKCSLNFGSRAMKITTNAYINVEVDYKRLSEDLNKLIESRENDMVEMKKMYEERILCITTDSEALLAEAVANSEKSLVSIRSLHETQQTSWKDDIFKLQSELKNVNKTSSNFKMQLSALNRRIQRKDYQTRAVLLAEIMSMQLYYAIKSLTSSDQDPKHLFNVFDNGTIENELLPDSVRIIQGSKTLLQLLKGYINLGDSSASPLLSSFSYEEYSVAKVEDSDLFRQSEKHLFSENYSEVVENGSPNQQNVPCADESALYIANKTDDDKVVESGSCTPSELKIDCVQPSENSSCIGEDRPLNDEMSMASQKLMESLLEVKKDLDGKGISFLSQAFHIQLVKKDQDGGNHMSEVYTLLRENLERHQHHHGDKENDLISPSILDGRLSNLLIKEHSLSHVLVDKALQCSVMVLEHYQLKRNNADLCTQIAQLQDEIGSMKTQNATLQETTASAKTELQESNRQLTENVTSKEQLESGINSILQILEINTPDSGDLLSSSAERVGLDRLRTSVSALLEERKSAKKEATKLAKQNKKLTDEIIDDNKKMESLKGENCLLQQELQSSRFKLEEANTKQEHLESCMSSVFQLFESNAAEDGIRGEATESLIDRVINGELKSKVSCILENNETFQSEQSDLTKEKETLTNELNGMKEQLNETEERKANLNNELNTTNSKLEETLAMNEQLRSEINGIFELLNFNKENGSEASFQNESTSHIHEKSDTGKLFAAVSSLVDTKTNLESELTTSTNHLQETIATKEQLESDMSSMFQLFSMSGGSDGCEVEPFSRMDSYELSLEISSIIEDNQNLREELCDAQTEREGLEKQLTIAKNELQILKTRNKSQSRYSSRASSQENLPASLKDLIEGRLQIQEQCSSLNENRKRLDGSFTNLNKEIFKLEVKCSGSDTESGSDSPSSVPTRENLNRRLSVELLNTVAENSQLKDKILELIAQIKLLQATDNNKHSLLQNTPGKVGREVVRTHVFTDLRTVENKDLTMCAQDQVDCSDGDHDNEFEARQSLKFCDLAVQTDAHELDNIFAVTNIEEVDGLSDTISMESTANESFESCFSEAILTGTSRKGILDELIKARADNELMRQEIAGLEQKCMTSNNELHLCNKTREELEEKIAVLVENGKLMSAQVSAMKEKYEALEQQLVKTVEGKRLLEVKLEQLHVQNMENERENKALIEAKTFSEAQHLEEQRRLQQALLSLQEENEENKRLSGERERKLENIQTQKMGIERENRALVEAKSTSDMQHIEELSKLEKSLLTWKTENEETKRSLEEKTRQLEQIYAQQMVTEHENKVLVEAKSLSDVQHFEELSTLEKSLSTLKTENEETKISLEERTRQLERIYAQQMVTEFENKALVEAKSTSDVQHFEELSKLEKSLLTCKTENEETKRSLEERTRQLEQIHAQNMVTEHENKALVEAKSLSDAQHFEELSKLEKSLLTLKAENEETESLLEEQTGQLERICSKQMVTEHENKALVEARSLSDVQHVEELEKFEKKLLFLKEENEICKNIANEKGEELNRIFEQKKKLEGENKVLAETSESTQARLLELIRKLEHESTDFKEDTEENQRLLHENESESIRIQEDKKVMEQKNSSILEALALAQACLVEEGKRLEKELEALKKEKEEIEQISIIKQSELESMRNQNMETERQNKTLTEFKISAEQQFIEIKNMFEKELLEANEENEKCKRLAEEREKELRDLSHRLNSIDSFVQGIEAELTLTKEEKESYEKMLWSKDREFEDLKINLVSSKEQLHKLGEELSTTKKECNCLKNELRVRESQRALLRDQLNCLIDLPELKPGGIEMPLPSLNSELNDENSTKEVELRVHRQRSEDENTKLNSDLTLAKEQLLKLKEDVTLSNLQTRNLGTQLSSLRENSNQLEAELSTMRKPRQPRSRSHSITDETLRLEMELADSKQRIIDLQKKIIDVHNEKAIMVDRLALSEVQLEKVSLALDTLLKDKSNTVVQLEGDVSNYKKEKEELENILAVCETGMNIGESKTLLKDQLENVVKATTALKTQISESNNKVTQLEEELAKNNKEKNKMENELAELRVWTKLVSESQSENVKQFEKMERLKDELKRNLRAENDITSDLEQSVTFYKKENERLECKFNDLEKATCDKFARKYEQMGEMARAMESKERDGRVDELREELQWYKMEKKRLELLLEKYNNECMLSRQGNDQSKDTKQEIKRMENTMSSLLQAKLRLEEEVSDLNEGKVRLENIEHLVNELLLVEKQKTKLKRNLEILAANCGSQDETIDVENRFMFEEGEIKATLKGYCSDNVPSASKVLLRTLQELEHENSTISEENNSLKFRILDLEKELEFLTFKLSIKEKSQLSGGKKALATVLASVKQQREELQKALNVLSGEKEDLEEEILALRVKSTHLQKDLALSNLQKDNFEIELNALRNKLFKVNLLQENELNGNPVETNFQLASNDLILLSPKKEKGSEPEVERREITIGNANGLSLAHRGKKGSRKSTKSDKDRRKDSTKERSTTTSRRKDADARGSITGKRSRRALPSGSTSDLKSNALPRSNDNSDATVLSPSPTPACGDLIRFDNEPLVYTGNDNTDYMSGLVRVDPDDDRLPPEGMEDEIFSDTASISSSETLDEDYDEEIELSEALPDQRDETEYFEDDEVIVKRAWSLRRLFWGQSNGEPSDLNVSAMPQ